MAHSVYLDSQRVQQRKKNKNNDIISSYPKAQSQRNIARDAAY